MWICSLFLFRTIPLLDHSSFEPFFLRLQRVRFWRIYAGPSYHWKAGIEFGVRKGGFGQQCSIRRVDRGLSFSCHILLRPSSHSACHLLARKLCKNVAVSCARKLFYAQGYSLLVYNIWTVIFDTIQCPWRLCWSGIFPANHKMCHLYRLQLYIFISLSPFIFIHHLIHFICQYWFLFRKIVILNLIRCKFFGNWIPVAHLTECINHYFRRIQ